MSFSSPESTERKYKPDATYAESMYAMHKFADFVQEISSEHQSVHKYDVFVQQKNAAGITMHKYDVFVQQKNAAGITMHK